MKPGEVVVVTSCTKRKCSRAGRPLAMRVGRGESVDQFARRWISAVDAAEATVRAIDLYVGRAISEVRRASEVSGASTAVVSAGLGFLRGSQKIPNYNMTVTMGGGSILPMLRARNVTVEGWWEALTRARGQSKPLTRLIRSTNRPMVLIALPATYLNLIQGELSGLSHGDCASLRLFVCESNVKMVPEALRESIMPYDSRLEDTSFAGTRGDFPQRALSHFVANEFHRVAQAKVARSTVEKSLKGLKRPHLPERARKTNEEIAVLLRRNWAKHEWRAGRALRYLRDEALVQCEQGRFKEIWKDVSAQHAT